MNSPTPRGTHRVTDRLPAVLTGSPEPETEVLLEDCDEPLLEFLPELEPPERSSRCRRSRRWTARRTAHR